jgi:hypothetical protein
MSGIVVVILIYYRHKPINLIEQNTRESEMYLCVAVLSKIKFNDK